MSGLLSLGQDRRWRRFVVSRVAVPDGARVLDAATGTAAVALELAARTGSRVVGLDQSEPMLREGRSRVARRGLQDRIGLLLGQAERLPFQDEVFDAVTFTYLLRYLDDPPGTLRELARVLRPGGTLACVEFHVPGHPLWRAAWLLHTRLVLPVVGAIVSPAWYRVGRFLGPSISGFYRRYPLAEQGEMWRAAGLRGIRARTMSLGGGVVMWGVKGGE